MVDHRGERTDGRQDLGALARSIVDSNLYMTLATADAEGRPWASPVWFAHRGYRDFLWVSRPEARHSRNLAVRPELALVLFDSTAAPEDVAAVYVEGRGEELEGRELERAIGIYSHRSEATGLAAWDATDVTGPARHRLYHLAASAHFLLTSNDERVEVVP
jgi:pyridoxine/pyridoxamine 5'-phosphate oxidase